VNNFSVFIRKVSKLKNRHQCCPPDLAQSLTESGFSVEQAPSRKTNRNWRRRKQKKRRNAWRSSKPNGVFFHTNSVILEWRHCFDNGTVLPFTPFRYPTLFMAIKARPDRLIRYLCKWKHKLVDIVNNRPLILTYINMYSISKGCWNVNVFLEIS